MSRRPDVVAATGDAAIPCEPAAGRLAARLVISRGGRDLAAARKRSRTVSRRVLIGLLSAAAVAACGVPAVAAAKARPSWLAASERQTLLRVFGGARPVHTYLIGYPHKIAVVWVFDHVVICGACSAPSNASLPRGRVIRLSYDRRTHEVRAADGMRFCEARGSYPPRAVCLRR